MRTTKRKHARAGRESSREHCSKADPSVTSLRRRRGRPSKYDPAYCDVVVELGREGQSRTEMAAALGVNRDTLSEWTKVHPDFRDAMRFALTCSQAWWEAQARVNLLKPFNRRLWIVNMQCRFPEDYR